MLQKLFIDSKVLIFRQWSRKPYAIFATANSVVNIGHLSADICNLAQLKTANEHLYIDYSRYIQFFLLENRIINKCIKTIHNFSISLNINIIYSVINTIMCLFLYLTFTKSDINKKDLFLL